MRRDKMCGQGEMCTTRTGSHLLACQQSFYLFCFPSVSTFRNVYEFYLALFAVGQDQIETQKKQKKKNEKCGEKLHFVRSRNIRKCIIHSRLFGEVSVKRWCTSCQQKQTKFNFYPHAGSITYICIYARAKCDCESN